MNPRSRNSRFALSSICALLVFITASPAIVAQRKRPARKENVPAPPARKTPAPTRDSELTLPAVAEDPEVSVADVAITARVRARELRFDVVPSPKVDFPCKPNCETSWEADRENLPTPVQPGVTYRNIGIRLRITSVFSDIDRIVAEALGEVPMTDDAKRAAVEPKKRSETPNVTPANPQAATTSSPGKQR